MPDPASPARRLTRWTPALVVLLQLAAVLVVDPRGEFPLNDDWSYTRSAFGLAAGRGLRIDEWSAPSLVGQALYGAAVARLFGPSFLALRLSTLVLACGLSLALWALLGRLGAPVGWRWIALLTWSFDPILFSLGFTFMTEVPFLFTMSLALVLLERHLATGDRRALAGCALALAYGTLIRQTALLFAAGAAAGLLAPGLGRRRALGPRLAEAACLATTVAACAAAHGIWVAAHGGPTPAARRKFELLGQIGAEQVVGNLLALAFYAAFLLLPLVVLLLPAAARLWRAAPPRRRRVALAISVAAAVGGAAWFQVRYGARPYLPSAAFHARMPYVLNILYDTGLGPVTLDPTYYRTPATPTYPAAWLVLTAAAAAALVVLGLAVLLGSARLGALRARLTRDRAALLVASAGAAALNALFEVVFSHRAEGGLFDRHILSVLLPLVPALGIVRGPAEPRPARACHAAAALLVAGAALFSIAATHDYLAWNRVRWELGRGLLARGADPLEVAGGFEFNGWHNYDVFRARGGIGTVYTWWYDDRRYLIALQPEPGYRVDGRQSYDSWVHRRAIPIYLLARATPPGAPPRPGR